MRGKLAHCRLNLHVDTPPLNLFFFSLSSCSSLLTWLMGVLVSGTVSVSEGSSPLSLLNKSTPLSHSQLIVLISAVVGAATKSVCLKFITILLGRGTEIVTLFFSIKVIAQFSDGLLPILRELSCHCQYDPTSQQAAQCYASVVNKLPQGRRLHVL